MEQETVLNVHDLSVTIDNNKILNDLNFFVKKGDVLAIVGPNGAGKSVLFRTLLGLFPYSGSIVWGQGLKTNYIPQKFYIDKDLRSCFFLPKKERLDIPTDKGLYVPLLQGIKEGLKQCDLAVLMGIHGEFAEDGRLQSLLKESTQEIERTNQRMCSELGSEISREKRDSIEKQAKERIQEIEHTYYRELEEILDTLKSLKKLQVTYNNGYETLQRFYEKFKRPEQTTLDAAEINALKRRFSLKKGHSTAGSSPESAEETISPATIEVGIRI